jgi:hypothetical protein
MCGHGTLDLAAAAHRHPPVVQVDKDDHADTGKDQGGLEFGHVAAVSGAVEESRPSR